MAAAAINGKDPPAVKPTRETAIESAASDWARLAITMPTPLRIPESSKSLSDLIQDFPHLADLPATLDDTTSGTLPRHPGSVRRSTTIDMVWPRGLDQPLHLIGRGRDLLTPRRGEPRILATGEMTVEIGAPRTVTAIAVDPPRDGIEDLVGAVGGAALRSEIDKVVPRERAAATPLHLLLDDIAGTSLIAGFALTRTNNALPTSMAGPTKNEFGKRKGKIICSGLRPDGWADTHFGRGTFASHAVRPAGSLGLESDSLAWHAFPPSPDVGMRRHRRIDVWRRDDELVVDAFFRDICWEPDGTQMALHEYTIDATVDARSQKLKSVLATPRVLPFPECKWAAPHVDQLVGADVTQFRTHVQKTLVELSACTHLNDQLRCLAEVPSLADHI